MDTDVASRPQAQHWPRSPSSANRSTSSDVLSTGFPQFDYDLVFKNEREGPRPRKPTLQSHPGQGPNYWLNAASARASQSCRVDHMLRRKTPNGTLAAGYDGRPIEWAARPPANKHFLMPASSDEDNMNSEPHVRHSFSTLNGEQMNGTLYDRYRAIRQNVGAFNPGDSMPSEAKSFANPGLDSVLYQSSPSHQFSHYSGGQHNPMVMQPMWPPCVGITSLNSPGPYGPYWPNGAFVPYRPAPIRDPRFHTGAASLALDGTWQNLPSGSDYSFPNLHKSRSPSEPDAPKFPTQRLPTARDRRVSDDHELFPSAAQGLQANLSSKDNALNISSNTPFESNSLAHPNERRALPNKPCVGLSLGSPCTASHVLSHPERHGTEANNVEFKERVLIWAHQVYLSLSCLKQQSKRTGPSVQYQNHRRPAENILPQLSQQTFSKLSTMARVPREQQQSYHHLEPPGLMHISHEEGAERTNMFLQSFADDRSLQSVKCHFFRDDQYTKSYEYSAPHSTPSKFQPRPLVHPGIQIHPESSPAAAAVSAIELLSRLCQESGWEWTDGLLLGGCLAYALGDYGKALKWYSKVLSCDPK